MTVTTLSQTTVDQLTWDRQAGVDRCDRCGAEAYFKVSMTGQGTLLFCAHHGREHSPALVMKGWCVLDYSHLLNEKPSPSANAD